MTDQRRYKRFELKLPIELVKEGSRLEADSCETSNLSSGGVLFRSPGVFEVGDPIEYRITFPGDSRVQLRCRGKVLRRSEGADPHVAATLERYEFVRGK